MTISQDDYESLLSAAKCVLGGLKYFNAPLSMRGEVLAALEGIFPNDSKPILEHILNLYASTASNVTRCWLGLSYPLLPQDNIAACRTPDFLVAARAEFKNDRAKALADRCAPYPSDEKRESETALAIVHVLSCTLRTKSTAKAYVALTTALVSRPHTAEFKGQLVCMIRMAAEGFQWKSSSQYNLNICERIMALAEYTKEMPEISEPADVTATISIPAAAVAPAARVVTTALVPVRTLEAA